MTDYSVSGQWESEELHLLEFFFETKVSVSLEFHFHFYPQLQAFAKLGIELCIMIHYHFVRHHITRTIIQAPRLQFFGDDLVVLVFFILRLA